MPGPPGADSLERDRLAVDLKRRLFGSGGAHTRVGVYTLGERLGAGATGEVFAAEDHRLDRRVAVKLLRPETGPTSRERVRREARLMAALNHPNVVQVFEVGEARGRMFIAMELVDGQSLSGWQRARSRDWTVVVEAYRQAGEGLAAAHAAGVVHRDFKPHNTMIEETPQGVRVRVLDFGLARAADLPSITSPSRPGDAVTLVGEGRPGSRRGVDLMPPLTMTGAVLGTPGYMAPEQIEGATAGPAADQFAWCVSLWEALYEERPYAGMNLYEIGLAVQTGQRRPVPRGSRVPDGIRRVLERGLSRDPTQRFASMRALLDALPSATVRRRGRRVLTLVALAGLVGVGWSSLAGGEPPPPCVGAGCTDVEPMHRDEPPPPAADAEAVQRVHELLAQARTALAAGDGGTARARVRQAATIESSLDYGPLRAPIALLRARVHADAEDFEAAADELHRAMTDATRWGQTAQRLEATQALILALGRDLHRGEDALEYRSLAEGLAGDDPEAQANTARVVGIALVGVGQLDAAQVELRRAGRLFARVRPPGHSDLLQVLGNVGGVLLMQGRFAEGRDVLADAVGQSSEHLGPEHPDTVWLQGNLATAHLELDELADAERLFAAVVDARSESDGPAHRQTLNLRRALAETIARRGRRQEAIEQLEDALDDALVALGRDDLDVALLRDSLAVVLAEAGQRARAIEHHRVNLRIREQNLHPQDPEIGRALHNLASVLASAERFEEAESLHRRALALHEVIYQADHPALADSRVGLARALLGQGRAVQALPLARQAWLRHQGEHVLRHDRGWTAFVLARALWAARNDPGARREAVEHARAALADFESAGGFDGTVDDIRDWLAAHPRP